MTSQCTVHSHLRFRLHDQHQERILNVFLKFPLWAPHLNNTRLIFPFCGIFLQSASVSKFVVLPTLVRSQRCMRSEKRLRSLYFSYCIFLNSGVDICGACQWEEPESLLSWCCGVWKDVKFANHFHVNKIALCTVVFGCRHIPPVPLRMSSHENFARMRLKLIENLHYDPHTEASQLRDNTAPAPHKEHLPPPIAVAKEARGDNTAEDVFLEEEPVEATVTNRPPSTTSEKAASYPCCTNQI